MPTFKTTLEGEELRNWTKVLDYLDNNGISVPDSISDLLPSQSRAEVLFGVLLQMAIQGDTPTGGAGVSNAGAGVKEAGANLHQVSFSTNLPRQSSDPRAAVDYMASRGVRRPAPVPTNVPATKPKLLTRPELTALESRIRAKGARASDQDAKRLREHFANRGLLAK